MSIRLSTEQIHSFRGDVLPLYWISDGQSRPSEISWRYDGDCFTVREFSDDPNYPYRDGILLTLTELGEGSVTLCCDGKALTCKVRVRERHKADPNDDFNFYLGDLHAHTTKNHNPEGFKTRESEFPIDYLKQIKDEGILDFCTVSDHADILSPREFMRGFVDYESLQPMDAIVFSGCEGEVNESDVDRYGIKHKNAGEIVVFNSDRYPNHDRWSDFYEEMEKAPFAVCILAHPQIMGLGEKYPGIWNFHLERPVTEPLKKHLKLIEVGNSTSEYGNFNLLYEYVYSLALDYGFRVSTSRGTDSHGPVWGARICEGKSIIMAKERSKEAFLDAINHQRIYCCQSGNVKLRYRVNGQTAPCDLPPSEQYDFDISLSYFQDDPDTHPIRCEIISDYGICVAKQEGALTDSIRFQIRSQSARYFFLRLTDRKGRKTWSPPVWTGREFDKQENKQYLPLPKNTCKVIEEIAGEDACVLVNDDPYATFTTKYQTASFLMDLGEIKALSALGVYHRIVTKPLLAEAGILPNPMRTVWTRQFPSKYRLSVSEDGECFNVVKEAIFRSFGGEEMLDFPTQKARYLRLEILSTVGKESGFAEFYDAKITLAELTPHRLTDA